jgi:hypothetical protein
MMVFCTTGIEERGGFLLLHIRKALLYSQPQGIITSLNEDWKGIYGTVYRMY